jgi:ParB-like nuclease domain
VASLPTSFISVRDNRTIRVSARAIAKHGYYAPTAGTSDRVKLERAYVAIVDGQRDPIKIAVGPDGRWEVADGRHRLRAGIDLGAMVLVKFVRALHGPGHGSGLTYVKRK